MRTNTEPYPAGVESLATTGAGELERLRFVLKHLTSWTYWYSHAEDVNFAHRMVRQHQTLVTDYRPMYRGEQTWSNAAVRFHGTTFSVVDAASHPESVLALWHVGGTVAMALSKRGDVHLGGSMAVAAGSVQHPSYTFVQDHQTGVFSAGQNTVAVGVGRNEVARFHGYGMLLAPHAAVSFRAAAGAAAGHVSALSLGAGDVVQLGDATRPLLLRSADITAAANRVFGYTAAGTALEAKAIVTGDNLTITHAAGSIRFDVLSTYTHTSAQTISSRFLLSGGVFVPAAHVAGSFAHASALYQANVVKAWVAFAGATGAIGNSYGVSSVTRVTTGTYTITWQRAFATAHYAVMGMGTATAGGFGTIIGLNGSPSATAVTIVMRENGTLVDPVDVQISAIGVQ